MVVIFWVGSKFVRTMAKNAAGPEDSSNSQPSATRSQKSAFESLFDEFLAADVEEPAREEAYNWDDSFEASVPVEEPVVAEAEPVPAMQEAASASSEEGAAFDLRQAVIYQTILTNKYLSEVPSQDN